MSDLEDTRRRIGVLVAADLATKLGNPCLHDGRDAPTFLCTYCTLLAMHEAREAFYARMKAELHP